MKEIINMAFVKPTVKTIKPDLKNVSIYIRSVKKFGKSTLFRDVIMEKYGDPTYGCLAEIGMEHGDELLDNLNTLHLDTYKDLIEFQKWLIDGKGTEHHIEIVGFDVADELVPLFDKETIRQHNIENPQKTVKSVKAAMGGYTAGEQYSATLMKNYFDKIKYVLSRVNYKLTATLHNTSLVPVRRLVFHNSKFVKYSKVDNYLDISMSFENYERFIC